MKKLLYFFLSICIFTMTSCTGEYGGENSDKNKNNNAEISYFAEFSFLPKYPGAQKISFTESTEEGILSKAEYSLPPSDTKSSTDKYASILEKDGWETDRDEHPNFIVARKSDHLASILFDDTEGELKLIISAK
ncbi:hypothetical protein [Oceanirhabdus sp. W0125-5]|uniref:hypothetical protein n=1 Tax=Oceanirhabdus sp. W0125-5 TaxID=2999116 RepID=UPI0022F2EFCA|nr:hypothetical protein [Oceanirhabdus sp. W0125-5]WBW98652.1 hypothetical protein OW730_07810 [Oceanirhabdus sp. W0125-5]